MKRPYYLRDSAKRNRWVKAHTIRKYRHRINQLVSLYCRNKRYLLFYQSDLEWENEPADPIHGWNELHLPQWKDINDPWSWD